MPLRLYAHFVAVKTDERILRENRPVIYRGSTRCRLRHKFKVMSLAESIAESA